MSEDVNDDIKPSNIGTILHDFEPDDRKIVRSWENLAKKQTNTRYAVIFTQTHAYVLFLYMLIFSYVHRRRIKPVTIF